MSLFLCFPENLVVIEMKRDVSHVVYIMIEKALNYVLALITHIGIQLKGFQGCKLNSTVIDLFNKMFGFDCKSQVGWKMTKVCMVRR